MTDASKTPERRCIVTGNPCGTDTVAHGQECPGRGRCIWATPMEAMINHAFAEYGHIGDRPGANRLRDAVKQLETERDEARAEREALRKALREAHDWIAEREYGEEWPTEDMFDGSQRHILNRLCALLEPKP